MVGQMSPFATGRKRKRVRVTAQASARGVPRRCLWTPWLLFLRRQGQEVKQHGPEGTNVRLTLTAWRPSKQGCADAERKLHTHAGLCKFGLPRQRFLAGISADSLHHDPG